MYDIQTVQKKHHISIFLKYYIRTKKKKKKKERKKERKKTN